MSVALNGVPVKEEIEKVMPPEDILAKKPVVMVECFQNIPCDPCAASCPFGAILPFEDINDLPAVDYDKCTGCGICVTSCPGLAIFVLDMNYSDEEALIKLPYEMLPLPQKGEMVSGLDREGHKVAEVKVDKVTKTKNKTYLISIVVPKELALIIRNIRVEDKTNG
ncbi:MAG: 4Fe-4S binding protein [Atribacterota bacterium]|jgi:Fe-S-cluster-containing hydrogenase component 2|nr:4Fe-4S binding protein [Atribacterota bacterium]MDY0382446.1 4Fe-4S binding protein [Atribacterota bacterium]